MKEKIAFCLYGQPRIYKTGYQIYKKLMDDNPQYDFDIFFHAWFDENIEEYEGNNYIGYYMDIYTMDCKPICTQTFMPIESPKKERFVIAIKI